MSAAGFGDDLAQEAAGGVDAVFTTGLVFYGALLALPTSMHD